MNAPASASSSIQEAVSDAKKLASRLKKYDASTDSLLSKAQTLEKTVDSMKEVSGFSLSFWPWKKKGTACHTTSLIIREMCD